MEVQTQSLAQAPCLRRDAQSDNHVTRIYHEHFPDPD